MKKIISVLLLMLAVAINAQESKQVERTYKFTRITEPNKKKGDWTNGSFGLIINYQNQIDKIQLVMEKATLLFRQIAPTKTFKTAEGIKYQEAEFETTDGLSMRLKLYPTEAKLVFSDGSTFEFSN